MVFKLSTFCNIFYSFSAKSFHAAVPPRKNHFQKQIQTSLMSNIITTRYTCLSHVHMQGEERVKNPTGFM